MAGEWTDQGPTLAAAWLDLRSHGFLVQLDAVAVALFVRNTFVIDENVLHQEPGCLIDIYVILQQGRMWKYGDKEHLLY